jgi:phosphatidylglycerophosphate synthase
MKNLANLVSIGRMFLSVSLVPLRDNIPVFVLVYLACGASDVLDGMIARKTGSESVMGARLDSLADVLMFGAVLWVLLLKYGETLSGYLPLVGVVVLLKLGNVAIAMVKFRCFVIGLHTWGNKLTGLLVYSAPLLLLFFRSRGVILPIFIVSVLAALEEGAIHLASGKLDLNRKSLFLKQ